MITLLIATRNAHKANEIRAILGSGFDYLTLNDFPEAPEVIEDAATFDGNAAKKAVELANWLRSFQSPKFEVGSSKRGQVFVLADDSGLEVDALSGAPGVHSARFAALDTGESGNSTNEANNAKLLRLLKDVPQEQRSARFRCVLAMCSVFSPQSPVHGPQSGDGSESANDNQKETKLFQGTCEGRIGFELRGKGGFGYDPLFFPAGYDRTFGELSEAVKNRLSHRAKALEKFKDYFVEGRER
jgi:XTP/dITP diphosphohydrolase